MVISFDPRTIVLALVFALATDAIALAGSDTTVIQRGQSVYATRKCQACHSIAGKGNRKNPLDGIGARLPAADIRRWITHPVEMQAKTNSTKKPPMPDMYGMLAAADIDAMVAYLQTLN